MGNFQNSYAYDVVQTVVFFGAAFAADRYLLTGVKKGGPYLFAGIASTVSVISPHIFPSKDGPEYQRLARVVISIAIAAIATQTVAKWPNVRSIALLGGVEMVVSSIFMSAIIIIQIPPKTSEEISEKKLPALVELHKKVQQTPLRYDDGIDHSSFVKECYYADLSVLPLGGVLFSDDPVGDTRDFSEKSNNQLDWDIELHVQYKKNLLTRRDTLFIKLRYQIIRALLSLTFFIMV